MDQIKPGMREIMAQGQTEQQEGQSSVSDTSIQRKRITSLCWGYVKYQSSCKTERDKCFSGLGSKFLFVAVSPWYEGKQSRDGE